MKILLTGAAGFIGAAVAEALLIRGDDVLGVDNLNEYYDVKLKTDRLARLLNNDRFEFVKMDITNNDALDILFKEERPERVVHLAAQAGVRHSLKYPRLYVNSNLVGFLNILEGCRHNDVEHLVYASSSSVYGEDFRKPFSVKNSVDHPLSLYGATKKSNELMAHSYSHLYNLPTTGLRFFTVYGPWGRPDMALFIFTKEILAGKKINIFNNGQHRRDFTYIDDVVKAVISVADNVATSNVAWSNTNPDPASSNAPYRIYNVGNNHPVSLMQFIEIIEKKLGKEAEKNYLPIQPGDVLETFADVDSLIEDLGFSPDTSIEIGISKFVDWYLEYYKVR